MTQGKWGSTRATTRQKGEAASDYTLQSVQVKFSKFLDILDNNNEVLKIISDMEEKSLGDYLFDINYIRSRLAASFSGSRTSARMPLSARTVEDASAGES